MSAQEKSQGNSNSLQRVKVYRLNGKWDDQGTGNVGVDYLALVKFENLASVHSLKVKYEQCLQNCGIKADVNVLHSRKLIDERALEKEEEDYFNKDSDKEDTTSESRTRKIRSLPVSSDGVAANYPSLRSGGLVNYDDDDEDYRPPPKQQIETSDDDEGALESLQLKRKLISREHESNLACKKPGLADGNEGLNEENHTVEESNNPREDNHGEKKPPRNCSDCFHSPSDGSQPSSEDCPLIPPKSSPEMAVNGS